MSQCSFVYSVLRTCTFCVYTCVRTGFCMVCLAHTEKGLNLKDPIYTNYLTLSRAFSALVYIKLVLDGIDKTLYLIAARSNVTNIAQLSLLLNLLVTSCWARGMYIYQIDMNREHEPYCTASYFLKMISVNLYMFNDIGLSCRFCSLTVAMVCGFLLGLGDSSFNTQVRLIAPMYCLLIIMLYQQSVKQLTKNTIIVKIAVNLWASIHSITIWNLVCILSEQSVVVEYSGVQTPNDHTIKMNISL